MFSLLLQGSKKIEETAQNHAQKAGQFTGILYASSLKSRVVLPNSHTPSQPDLGFSLVDTIYIIFMAWHDFATGSSTHAIISFRQHFFSYLKICKPWQVKLCELTLICFHEHAQWPDSCIFYYSTEKKLSFRMLGTMMLIGVLPLVWMGEGNFRSRLKQTWLCAK